MGLVRTWTGQLARAAGASLIAPLVLLLAAGVVASAGGLTSIASLGEIASGPALPDIGLNAQPGSALENADIPGADLSPADASATPAPSADALASAAPPASGGPQDAVDVAPPGAPPQPPAVQPFELREPPATSGGGETAPTAPTTPQAPAVPAPVEDLLEATRGLGDSLREPLRPLTEALRELLGPPPR